MTFSRPTILLCTLALLSAGALLLAISTGSAAVSLREAVLSLVGRTSPATESLIVDLRLPRALTAYAVGGLLALSGAFMQVLLRNPLAEPYILGTSGGAAVAALTVMVLGGGTLLIDVAAFCGALGAAFLVFAVARASGDFTPTRLLLTGVVLAAGFGALTTLLLALSPEQQLRGMLFWLMGDLSFAYSPNRLLALLAALMVAGTLGARYLDVLSLGDLRAQALGIGVSAARLVVFSAAALAVAMSVTAVGVIGFVGLVVPHIVRLLAGSAHRTVVPAAALAGGSLLVVADTLARSIVAPRQLPVGALTAALGVPLFLVILRHRSGGYVD